MTGFFFGNESPTKGIDVISPPTAETLCGLIFIVIGGLLQHILDIQPLYGVLF